MCSSTSRNWQSQRPVLKVQTTKPNLSVADVSLVPDPVQVYLRICFKSQVLQAPEDAAMELSSGRRLPPSGQMPTEHGRWQTTIFQSARFAKKLRNTGVNDLPPLL